MVTWKSKNFHVEESGRALYITWHSPGAWIVVAIMLAFLGFTTTSDSYATLDPYPVFALGVTMLSIAAACAVIAAMRRSKIVVVPEQVERHVGIRRFTRGRTARDH